MHKKSLRFDFVFLKQKFNDNDRFYAEWIFTSKKHNARVTDVLTYLCNGTSVDVL